MKKVIYFQSLIIVLLLNLSQTSGSEPEDADIQRPMPPSPTAAALGLYGEYPVSMSTGTPEISIPIYEIRSKKLNLPISLSYHATGIKVDQYASWVGLGWSLNAGGVITRSVFGLPDENYNGYFNWEDEVEISAETCFNVHNNDHEDYYFLEALVDELYDTQPDIFFYNIVNDAGKFVISRDTVRTIPFNPIKIVSDLGNGGNKFTITSTDGTIYRFGISLEQQDAFETTKRFIPGMSPRYSVSAWYLTEMISADYSDTIFFKYVSSDLSYGSTLRQSLKYYHNFDLWPNVNPEDLSHFDGEQELDWDEDGSALYIDEARKLSEIRFSNGIVKFNSTVYDREDLNGERKLNSIEIYSKDNLNVPIKRFNFSYSYFNAEVYGDWETNLDATKKKRLRLDSFTEEGKAPYEFQYSSIPLPPIHSFRQDHWGFFNDEKLNVNLIQRETFNGIELGGANRTPNPAVVTAGMLEYIYYPTGGHTHFIFEAHDYLEISSNAVAKQIQTFGFTPALDREPFAGPGHEFGKRQPVFRTQQFGKHPDLYPLKRRA